MMNAMTVFNGNGSALATRETTRTNGLRAVTFQTKKEYGIVNRLKGQELRRAHDKYRASFGVQGNSGITGLIATGQILVQKVSETKNGFNASFIRASVLDLEADPKQVAATLTDEELMAILKARSAAKEAAELAELEAAAKAE